MNDRLSITVCPVCASTEIRAVRGPWRGAFRGTQYQVADLEYYSCPNCGEKVYPPEAMRRIQAASPAFGSRKATLQPKTRRQIVPTA